MHRAMLEAKPSRLSRATGLGAGKSPSEWGSLLLVLPNPSRPHISQGGCAGSWRVAVPSEGAGADAMMLGSGRWHRGSSAWARARNPCRPHAGFLQRQKCPCSTCPAVDPGQTGHWRKPQLPSPPLQIMKFGIFIIYFPYCAYFQVSCSLNNTLAAEQGT